MVRVKENIPNGNNQIISKEFSERFIKNLGAFFRKRNVKTVEFLKNGGGVFANRDIGVSAYQIKSDYYNLRNDRETLVS